MCRLRVFTYCCAPPVVVGFRTLLLVVLESDSLNKQKRNQSGFPAAVAASPLTSESTASLPGVEPPSLAWVVMYVKRLTHVWHLLWQVGVRERQAGTMMYQV